MQLRSFQFEAMASACEIHLVSDDEATARTAAHAAAAEVHRIEQKYSRYRADSVLSGINAVAARGGAVNVDEETAGLLDYASACFRKSGGLFDITSGPLRRAWDFKAGRLPTAGQIERILPWVGFGKLSWSNPRLGFSVAGMEIDFGGIGKEYAADRAAETCMDHSIAHGLVSLGGDVRVIGPHPDGSPWRIDISDPRGDGSVAVVDLVAGGLATSGDYERFIEIDGRRYCHILDPRTGWPAQGLASVTVVEDKCLVAGSVSTIAMLKGRDGPAWLAELGVRHLWIDADGNRGGTLPL